MDFKKFRPKLPDSMKTGLPFDQNILLMALKDVPNKNEGVDMQYKKSKGDIFREDLKEVMDCKDFEKLCEEEFRELVISFEKIEENSA